MLPEQLQAELNLARGCGCTGYGTRRARQSCRVGRSGGRKRDEVRRVEIGPVQEVEEFRPELQAKAFANPGVLKGREIPSGESRTDIGVPPHIAVKSAVRGRRQKSVRIKPLVGIPKNDGPGEAWIEERSDRIASVAVVRWVVAKLRRKREPRLRCDDAGNRPATCQAIAPTLKIVGMGLAAAEG